MSEHEHELRRRRDKLEALLPAIAGALDVRVVFPRMSAVIQEVIPHDTLALALLTPDRLGVRIHASINFEVSELEEYRFTSDTEAISSSPYWLTYEMTVLEEGVVRARLSPPGAPEPVDVEIRPGPLWTGMLTKLGIRSSLRVPIRSQDQPIGGLSFSSTRPAAYSEDDIPLAARIADHVSLALAHERLAEEARRTARAEERSAQLEARADVLAQELERLTSHRALGHSRSWKRVLSDATKVADTDTTVLITGESGTGKEVVARYIHRGSRRSRGPFVALNCAALPEQLLESELFGYERGAFTGAHNAHTGKIEQAAGGVLFLDEVGEMNPTVQAKFLRVLQEREFQRLGSARTLKADIRVIAATNRDPKLAMERGTLREDLYYRLSVFEIALPPLRERKEDIFLLVEAFLTEISRSVGRPAGGLSEEARDRILTYTWPGNVRELRNAIERAVILCDGGLITSEHLPIAVGKASRPVIVSNGDTPFPPGGVKLEEIERDLLHKAMAQARNNKSQAAKLLGISRGQLYSLLKHHGFTEARR